MAVIGVVIAVVLVPTIWTAIYTDAIDAGGVNGTTKTLLLLVPMIYVGAVVIGGAIFALKG